MVSHSVAPVSTNGVESAVMQAAQSVPPHTSETPANDTGPVTGQAAAMNKIQSVAVTLNPG